MLRPLTRWDRPSPSDARGTWQPWRFHERQVLLASWWQGGEGAPGGRQHQLRGQLDASPLSQPHPGPKFTASPVPAAQRGHHLSQGTQGSSQHALPPPSQVGPGACPSGCPCPHLIRGDQAATTTLSAVTKSTARDGGGWPRAQLCSHIPLGRIWGRRGPPDRPPTPGSGYCGRCHLPLRAGPPA